ncbi:hypothetical protein QTO34_011274 [Cnephaeus nilssonii]|uniref:Uncharacterized protein n=1 Tax=Cnephaeus nilssonii TaxID=3371016 RepID=A0AA40HE05_CNENI|nr:hypothetical protein QTO34_011274 [Eptesicus nilssonii]
MTHRSAAVLRWQGWFQPYIISGIAVNLWGRDVFMSCRHQLPAQKQHSKQSTEDEQEEASRTTNSPETTWGMVKKTTDTENGTDA